MSAAASSAFPRKQVVNMQTAGTTCRVRVPARYVRAVRKQYHFRPSESGLCAWDVAHLILLTRGQPEEIVPLEGLRELDENWSFAFGEEPTVHNVV